MVEGEKHARGRGVAEGEGKYPREPVASPPVKALSALSRSSFLFFCPRALLVPALSPFAFFFSRSFTFAGSQGARSSGLPSSGLAALLVRGESASSMDRGVLPVSEAGVERRVRQVSSVARGRRRASSEKPSIPE